MLAIERKCVLNLLKIYIFLICVYAYVIQRHQAEFVLKQSKLCRVVKNDTKKRLSSFLASLSITFEKIKC